MHNPGLSKYRWFDVCKFLDQQDFWKLGPGDYVVRSPFRFICYGGLLDLINDEKFAYL